MRLSAIALTAAAFMAAPLTASAVEEPEHTIIQEDGKIQVRAYAPLILAEVEVTGDMRRAGNSGFRPLAGYIFGDNTTRAKIEMTAPVTRVPTSQKIEMTAPVTRIPTETGNWIVTFTMPAEWTMETLPVPNNPNVTLREVPGEMIAAINP